MRIKYNRLSSISQTGNRYEHDTEKYDLTILDRISGSVPFFERPKGIELKKLVEDRKVNELVVEEFSRLGRNTGDVINTLDWLDKHDVNVYVRNIGLYSRPNGVKNPIWKMISSVMSSLYEMELDNIRERTHIGRLMYIQKGGVLGRKIGTTESENDFITKKKSILILDYLKKEYTIREICKLCDVSIGTTMKVKKIGIKLGKLKNG
jgi:DNA invertase Pin-like site-specific DNA recombinase